MRIINKWSYACANGLTKQMNENHEKRRVFYFGFQVILGTLAEIVALVVVSLVLGIFIPTMISMTVFMTLRMIAGGYHMNTYEKCFFTSLGLFIISGSIAKYSYDTLDKTYIIALIIITIIIGGYLLYRWAPADTPNKRITDAGEIKKFKRLSIFYLFIWLVIVIALLYYNQHLIVISACFGILVEAFMITPMAYRFFDKVSLQADKAFR